MSSIGCKALFPDKRGKPRSYGPAALLFSLCVRPGFCYALPQFFACPGVQCPFTCCCPGAFVASALVFPPDTWRIIKICLVGPVFSLWPSACAAAVQEAVSINLPCLQSRLAQTLGKILQNVRSHSLLHS